MSEVKRPEISSQEIDFLPSRFREESVQRKIKSWRLFVAGAFGVLLLCMAMLQFRTQRSLQNQLSTIGPEHQAAEALAARLAELQLKLEDERTKAELVTYLRHPWPRTQILAAVLAPLPETIHLGELTIEEIVKTPGASQGTASSDAAADKKEETPRPVKQDLDAMHRQYDGRTTTVSLWGDTRDVSGLHAYLTRVAENPLVAKAELLSIERKTQDEEERIHFRARLTVVPAYGQLGGPRRETKADDEQAHQTSFSQNIPGAGI